MRRPVRFRRWALLCLAAVVALAEAGFAASPDDPAIKQAIARGREQLLGDRANPGPGYGSLAAYALVKSGVPPTDPAITKALKALAPKFTQAGYEARTHHYYEAGCDLMLLEAVDPVKYEPQMRAIVIYLLGGQNQRGAWYYRSQQKQNPNATDQSISQYAVLGLWAAERGGVHVPRLAWDRLAAWQVSVQLQDGGFAYHPSDGGGGGGSKPTMTVAGIANLYVARQYLYPNAPGARRSEPQRKDDDRPKPKFGVLDQVDTAADAAEAAAAADEERDDGQPVFDAAADRGYQPRTPLTAIDNAIRRGMQHMAAQLPRGVPGSWPQYYLYGIERMAALAGLDQIGAVDWYGAGAQWLLKNQNEDGGWGGSHQTAFALLFLSQATRQILDPHHQRGSGVGAGLLAGGRGLPEDLSTVDVRDGEVEQRQASGPLDELLTSLVDPEGAEAAAAQEAIIDKLRLGDREELVGQADRLRELAEHPNPEVRRTAIWALGRTDDLKHVNSLLAALRDPSLDVAVEARNALCFLSKKTRGLGAPDDPLAGLPEDATEQQRTAKADEWKADVFERWAGWAREKQLYDERNRIDDPTTLVDSAKNRRK